MKEIAAVKCIIDYRIAYYPLIGRDPQRYVKAALVLHKFLTRNTVEEVNKILECWLAGFKLSFLVV